MEERSGYKGGVEEVVFENLYGRACTATLVWERLKREVIIQGDCMKEVVWRLSGDIKGRFCGGFIRGVVVKGSCTG